MMWGGYGLPAIEKMTLCPKSLLRDIFDYGQWAERDSQKQRYRGFWAEIVPQWKAKNWDLCERWFTEKGLMVPPTDEILRFSTGTLAKLPKKVVTQTSEMAIPGIQDLFIMAKESGCSEQDVFSELATMLKANAVVSIGAKGVDYIPVPENPETDSDGNLIISDMVFNRSSVVPDVNRRMKALDHLTKTLGLTLRDRAALVEADEKARGSAEDREIKREALNQRKKDGKQAIPIAINMG